jgi:DNA-binding transcriptional regulator YdaS (Cro superfamily)
LRDFESKKETIKIQNAHTVLEKFIYKDTQRLNFVILCSLYFLFLRVMPFHSIERSFIMNGTDIFSQMLGPSKSSESPPKRAPSIERVTPGTIKRLEQQNIRYEYEEKIELLEEELEIQKAAAEEVAYEGVAQGTMGEMIALKSSPVWKALGNGAGGYRDTLGNPYPPFAFSSGLGWQDVSREKCVRLGLITDGEKVEAPTPSLRIGEEAVLQARRTGFARVLKDI